MVPVSSFHELSKVPVRYINYKYSISEVVLLYLNLHKYSRIKYFVISLSQLNKNHGSVVHDFVVPVVIVYRS